MTAELNENNEIILFSLTFDKDITYNISNTITFDKLESDIEESNINDSGEINTLALNTMSTSSDSAIIGEQLGDSTYDDIYAHTTIAPLSLGENSWMGTRVFTQDTHYLSTIRRVTIDGTEDSSAHDILYINLAALILIKFLHFQLLVPSFTMQLIGTLALVFL